MNVHLILIIAIVVIGATWIALALTIIINKAWRDEDARWRRNRRRELTPKIERYQRGECPTITSALQRPTGARDRSVIEQVLLERIHDADGIERDRLARAIDELGFVDAYLPQLKGRNWWRRADAAEKLGLAVARRTIDDLSEAMNDDVHEVRFRAARALGQLGGLTAIRILIKALDTPDRWSTIRIAEVLTSMGREVGDELTTAFEQMGPRARAATLDILAAVGHLQVGPWIRERLRDSDPDVRSRAASALGTVGDMAAGPELVTALQDPEWPVRAMAAKALGVILHLPALPELCDALRDREWWVRVNAAEALRVMGPVGLDALIRMLDDTDAYARHQAVFVLEESGVVDERVDLLFDASHEASSDARSLVRRIIHTGQHGRLSELASRHGDDRVRQLLAHLLGADAIREEAAS
jgi:HEAT repeat protein